MTPELVASRTHLVIIPSYNSGSLLSRTVAEALEYWQPVWVVMDGSTDGSEMALETLRKEHANLRVLRLKENQGKGGAVLHAMAAAQEEGFRYALVMDADGQHPAQWIPRFMEFAERNPEAMVLGVPQFGPDAPASRELGRRVGNWWANLETLWHGIEDSLFGFRVYPIAEAVGVLRSIRGGRRYDFDTQLAVRLFWEGVRPINVPVPVRYLSRAQGGISHFRYVRDNALLIRAHTWLVLQMPYRMMRWRLKGGRVRQSHPMKRVFVGYLVAMPFLVLLSWPMLSLVWFWCAMGCALLVYGSLRANCQWFGPVITRFATDRNEVWLTIDDGPHLEDTPRLLELLKRHGARATFFVVGRRAQEHPELISAILEEGHSLGNHSQEHPVASFWCCSRSKARREIGTCAEVLSEITGQDCPRFRAPVGMANWNVHDVVRERRMALIGWSARGLDGVSRDAARIAGRILRCVRPGSIILLHEGQRDEKARSVNVATLEAVLGRLREQGYDFVLPEQGRWRTG